MSRIGKKPIVIPKGVQVTLTGDNIAIKGPKGALSRVLPPNAKVEVKKDEICVEPGGVGRRFGAFHGLTRALLANMVMGVSEGFKKDMSLVGVGYRVTLQGKKLVFNLGFSHPIEFDLPKGIEAEVGERGANFSIKGVDRELVGQICATIRGFRPPEPYKGKGIRYTGEFVRQKAGKTSVK
ncbi:MAG: 50S ribosomal protein L6 [Deltaproteobacteria bacterium]|nr:50S ribosomal protein L6 [Deltaproteobacteria bacterium]